MLATSDITGIAHVIQLAVAPVFLLTGIAGLLSVLVNRLGRVVDRFRTLHGRVAELQGAARESVESEMAVLGRRTWFIHRAIALCTGSALLVCMVIATLFIGSLVRLEASMIIATLFILAMVSLVVGLLFFLREIHLSTGYIHVLPR
ncbi:MAG: DUF2721 domain-containing protein [Betaproteobacteria bacterium]|nr:DUF2721 domain-containing protein [Betaproteobacteria bacterium]